MPSQKFLYIYTAATVLGLGQLCGKKLTGHHTKSMRKVLPLVAGFLILAVIGWSAGTLSYKVVFVGLAGIAILLITLINVDAGLSILVLTVPLTQQFELDKIALAPVDIGTDDVLVFCLLVGWLGYCAKTKRVPVERTSLNRPFLVYFAVMLLSLIMVGLKLGTKNVLISALHIAKWYEYALLFFLVVATVRTKRDIEKYLTLMIIGCAIVALIQFYQMATGKFAVRTWTPRGLLPRVGSTFDSIGILGAYYVLFVCVLVAKVIEKGLGRVRWLYLALVVAVSAALFTTYARAAYVGLFAGVIVLGIFSGGRRGLIIAIAALIMIPGIMNPWSRLRVKMTVVTVDPQLEFEESAEARLYVWRQSVRFFLEHPVMGIGFWASRYQPEFGYSTPHSQYLSVLVELGLIGFAVFLWLGVRMIRTTVALLRTARDPALASLALGYLAGLLGVLTHAIFGETLESFRVTGPMWALMGLVFAALRLAAEEPELPVPEPVRLRPGVSPIAQR